MKIDNPLKKRGLIEGIIKKYGHTPDHNFDWLMYCANKDKPQIAIWKDKYAIWNYKKEKEWIICSNPIAPAEVHQKLAGELINYLFEKDVQKIYFLDVRENIKNFCKERYSSNYTADYELVWPVFNMDKFDLSLPGGHFKSIRNAKNKFYKENNVEVTPTSSADKNELHKVVDRWKEHRNKAGIEKIFPNRYHTMIDNNFAGTKSARAMLVNGKIAGFNAGWETPNTLGDYSAAVGIHDFSTKDLGLTLLLEDFSWIKKAGYKTCDLEGSESKPLKFKMQFLPEKTYKTYSFHLRINVSSGS